MNKVASLPTVLAALTLLCALAGAAAAQDEAPRITIQELKSLIDKGADVLVADAQPKAVYEKGHIKGAVSFPWKAKIRAEDAARLPHGKLIVTYCDCGPGESDSAAVAAQLLALGFEDVKVLADPSIRGWKAAGYPME